MPQMMPINWMLSLLFFILIFIMFNIMNYYIIVSKENNLKSKWSQKINFFNWKW